MDAASATLESPLDSSEYIIAQLVCPAQRHPCRGSSYRHLLPVNPGSERERRINSGLIDQVFAKLQQEQILRLKTLFAQFNQLTLRVLIVRIQLNRPGICHPRILDIVRRLVTISKAVPCIRGIGIGLCV